jgi:phosphate transport system protein
MTPHLQTEIEELKKRLTSLGLHVAAGLEESIEALLSKDAEAARRVISQDDNIDKEEVRIEEECFKVIALYQPVTRELRLIGSVLKANNDLERIGDHAVNIANVAIRLHGKTSLSFPPNFAELAKRVPEICRKGLQAFTEEDLQAAYEICRSDNVINDLKDKANEEVLALLEDNPARLEDGILIYRVAHELERVGDLMKNISEDTIYFLTGKICRHGLSNL